MPFLVTTVTTLWKRSASTVAHVALGCVLAAGMGIAWAAEPRASGGSTVVDRVDTSTIAPRPLASSLPDGWQRGAFMEIFVRAYKDSNGDGIGDLKGLTQQLDYLKDLGIKGIWLMPINANADGDHGYATTDYRALDPAYGTLEDFDELLRQAHARGIGIIMDYVINHSAKEHPMFTSALRDGPASPFYNWYVWEKESPPGWDIWGSYPWTQTPHGSYYGTFGKHMPDFNFKNPAVLDYHESSMRFWLNRGLDGFRLDAVPHLVENSATQWNDQPESRRITGELRSLITAYPNRQVVCEATANPQVYAAPEICGSAFAFGLERNIVNAVKGDQQAVRFVGEYFTTAPQTMATFVANHDIFAGERLWDQLKGNMAQYKLAAASYLLQPGTPFIYYGEEIGMAGIPGLPGDQPLRAPMRWTAEATRGGFTTGTPFRAVSPNGATNNAASQVQDHDSLLTFYKRMLALRNQRPSLSGGSYRLLAVDGTMLAFQRTAGAESTLVAINYGSAPGQLKLPGLAPNVQLETLYPQGGSITDCPSQAGRCLGLGAQSMQVFNLSTH